MKQFYASRLILSTLNRRRSSSRSMLNAALLLLISFLSNNVLFAQGEPFTKRVVATGFNSAWEVVYGPNDSLWVTENVSYLIRRVSVTTGVKTTLLSVIPTEPTYNFAAGTQPQGGLMGLALHPALYSTNAATRAAKPWVYAVYCYQRNFCPGTNTMCYFTTKIVRYTYSGNTLINPVIVLDNIPGSSDHNSGRLVISPLIEPGSDAAHTQYRLYYALGDQGAGQFKNTTRLEHAQNLDSLPGKILRLNTESDGDAGLDAWIPNDNPFYNGAVIEPKDYVYSYGHRNPQGLAFGKISMGLYRLYSSEQMDQTDDEINIIESGRNYGWDSVAGKNDGNVDGHQQGRAVVVNENGFSSAPWNTNVKEPLFTFWSATAAQVNVITPVGGPNTSNNVWSTLAPSSIDVYNQNKIPGWKNSILMSPLKKDYVIRIKLNPTGDAVLDTIKYFAGDGNRLRRVIVDPTATKFYVARDAGATLNGGAIMEYTYTGVTLALPDKPVVAPEVQDEVEIFPNPVNDVINIKGKKNFQKPLRVQFYDISGVMVKEQTSNKNEFSVNVTSLKAGMYIVKLLNGYNVEVKVEKVYKQ